MRPTTSIALGLWLLGGCGESTGDRDASLGAEDASSLDAASTDAPAIDGASEPDAASRDAGRDAYVTDAGPMPLRVTVDLITDQHRFVPGAMFGGWGPHLGHLVRARGELHWVDDLCDPRAAGDCDVNVNRRVGVHRRAPTGWEVIATIPLSGVQQNTGTVATDTALHTYGIDVVSGRVIECRFVLASETSACAPIPIPIGPSANYVGAARARDGSRVAWWTNVVDGGGGSFSYVVDYGGGWNGPRSGPIAGYNDFAYAHAGFFEGDPRVLFFGQVVSGLAPAWAFSTLVGEASLATADAVSFTNALAAPAADAVASTNDLFVEPATNDVHLLARTTSGAVAYYHRPFDGPWSAPRVLDTASYRARFLVSEDWLAIASGPNAGGLRVRRFAREDVRRGGALALERAIDEEVPLPPSFGAVLGLYPEADVTQAEPSRALVFGAVGSGAENEAWLFLLE